MILVIEPNTTEVIFWAFEQKRGRLCSRRLTKSPDEIKNSDILQNVIRGLSGKRRVQAISFRINFGGNEFSHSAVINRKFFPKFAKLIPFMPVYISTCYAILYDFWKKFNHIPLKVFFETSFFNALPETERYYAIPYEYYPRDNIRRWGFHGTLHQMNALVMPKPAKIVSIVFDKQTTVSAIKERKPVTISLGYTPLEGIMSRTSCGDLDAGIVFYLMKQRNLSIFKIDQILKKESGFLGMTGYGLDMEQFPKYYGKDPKVDLAFSVYENQIIKYIGEGTSLLEGVDYVVFAGSITNSFIPVIYRILHRISFLGIQLRSVPWAGATKIKEATVSDSPVRAYLNRYTPQEIIFYFTTQDLRHLSNL